MASVDKEFVDRGSEIVDRESEIVDCESEIVDRIMKASANYEL